MTPRRAQALAPWAAAVALAAVCVLALAVWLDPDHVAGWTMLLSLCG